MSDEVELQQDAVTQAPESAEQQTGAAPDQETNVDTTAQSKTDDEEEHRVPKGVQKRIDRLTREKYQLQAQLEVLRQPQQAPQQRTQEATASAPKLENFASIEDYIDAMADHKATQKAEEVFRKRDAEQTASKQQAESSRVRDGFTKQMDDARAAYDDFDDVVDNPDLPISQAMAEAIMRTKGGADVAYYLGKNPAEAVRLANLDPFSAAVEIGRIAATVVRPQARKASNAPPPIQPVGSRASPVTDPDKMSAEEWMKWRNGQVNKKR